MLKWPGGDCLQAEQAQAADKAWTNQTGGPVAAAADRVVAAGFFFRLISIWGGAERLLAGTV